MLRISIKTDKTGLNSAVDNTHTEVTCCEKYGNKTDLFQHLEKKTNRDKVTVMKTVTLLLIITIPPQASFNNNVEKKGLNYFSRLKIQHFKCFFLLPPKPELLERVVVQILIFGEMCLELYHLWKHHCTRC